MFVSSVMMMSSISMIMKMVNFIGCFFSFVYVVFIGKVFVVVRCWCLVLVGLGSVDFFIV